MQYNISHIARNVGHVPAQQPAGIHTKLQITKENGVKKEKYANKAFFFSCYRL
jgi:hypothetical protein